MGGFDNCVHIFVRSLRAFFLNHDHNHEHDIFIEIYFIYERREPFYNIHDALKPKVKHSCLEVNHKTFNELKILHKMILVKFWEN